MTRDKKEFIEAILSWFNTPKVGNDEVLDRQFLADAYDNITHPHWISVEDELPEVGVAVLTITPRGTQRVGFYEDGWWLANYIDLVRMGSITHWMPLPALSCSDFPNNQERRVIGTADHIKTALDVMKGGGEE